MTAEVTLAIGADRFLGWTEAKVTRSIETLSGSFALKLTDPPPIAETARPIVPGDFCRVLLDDDVVLTGWVDQAGIVYDEERHELTVRGRDRTGDLADCSAAGAPGEWHDETLTAIVAALAGPFGIPVTAEVGVGEPFERFRIEEGETVFEAIDRACRFRAVLPVSNGRGGLVLTRPQRTRAETALVYGENILSGSASLSWVDRFSSYTLLGQQPGSDFLNAEQSAQVLAADVDPGISRHRPLTIVAEQALNDAEAAERIAWEANVRASRGRTVSYRVQGWRETDNGPLWEPGRLVPVVDPLLGLDRELLIGGTLQERGENGTVTALTLYPADAFARRLVPQPEETLFA